MQLFRKWNNVNGMTVPAVVENTLLSPFEQHATIPLIDQRESFLAKAIPFFFTDAGRTVGKYLNLCWDTLNNTVSTRAVVIGLVVEGLVDMLRKRSRTVRKAPKLSEQQQKESKRLNCLLEAFEFSDELKSRNGGFLRDKLPDSENTRGHLKGLDQTFDSGG